MTDIRFILIQKADFWFQSQVEQLPPLPVFAIQGDNSISIDADLLSSHHSFEVFLLDASI